MPYGPYTKVGTGTTWYGQYSQEHVGTFTSVAALKAFKAPRGNSGAMALLVTFGAIGGAPNLPTAEVFFWMNTETAADNGSTCLTPSDVTDATAGRWLKASALT